MTDAAGRIARRKRDGRTVSGQRGSAYARGARPRIMRERSRERDPS